MPKTRTVWSEEQDKLLREFRNTKTFNELAQMLGKTKSAVEQRSHKLGLQTDYYWTDKENVLLRQLWDKTPKTHLLRAINKSWYGIYDHARKMGLKHEYNPLLKIVDQIKPLSKQEKAYIAGFVDGEGTITFSVSSSKRCKRSLTPVFQISNTNKEALLWTQNRIGGNIVTVKSKRPSDWKVKYILRTNATLHVRQILSMLLPYLIIKRKAAELLLEYCNQRAQGPSRLTEKLIAIFEKFQEYNLSQKAPANRKHFKHTDSLKDN